MSWQSYHTRASTCPVSQHICLSGTSLQQACLPWVALGRTVTLLTDTVSTRSGSWPSGEEMFSSVGMRRNPRQDGYKRELRRPRELEDKFGIRWPPGLSRHLERMRPFSFSTLSEVTGFTGRSFSTPTARSSQPLAAQYEFISKRGLGACEKVDDDLELFSVNFMQLN
jgi:hypothetical protein